MSKTSEKRKRTGVDSDGMRAQLEASEKRAARAEARFADLVENVTHGLVLVDDGRLTCNAAVEAITGRSRDELPDLDAWFAAIHPGAVADHKRRYEKDRREGFPESRMLTYRRKDGVERQVRVHGFKTSTVEGWFVVDLTDQLAAEEAYAAGEHEYQSLFESLTEGFALIEVVLDDDGKPCNYVHIDVNPAFQELTGLSPQQVVGRPILDVLPELSPFWVETYGKVARTGEPARFENYSESLGRHYHVVAFPIGGPRVGILFTDVTRERNVEQELREAKEHYQSLFDGSRDGLKWIEPSGRIVGTNAAFRELVGYSEDELETMSYVDLTPGKWHAMESEIVGSLLSGERDFAAYEKECIHADGHIFPVSVRAFSRRDANGNVTKIWESVQDINDRLVAEKQRRDLEDKIQQAQKLESLGVLAGGIAHDFNNLLMSVLGNAEMAMSDLSPVSPAREYVADIETAARRAADLAKQMLAYSGKGRFIVTPLDINEVVREMTHLLSATIAKNCVLRFDLSDNLPAVEADATQIRQVVMNLITNASEAIGDASGVVSITTGAMDCTPEYLAETFLTEDPKGGIYTYLEVSDTGCGMDRQTMLKVFDPFFTTKFTGRGLGLAATLGIVRGHGGCLKVYSEPGRGSTFKMLFPSTNEPVVRQSTEAAGLGWKGSGTILLVDDEETVRAVGKRMLERIGFEVLTAFDGRHAIAVLEEFCDRIVCVVLDLTMPHMDGEQAYREIRRICPNTPVVLSSGYNEQDVTQRFAGKGLAGFIQKPYSFHSLAAAIRAVVAAGDEPDAEDA